MFGRRHRQPVVATTHHHAHHTTATPVAPRRRLFGRRRAARQPVVVHHHKRHATIGDKISGALLRLKGSLTGRPGQKAAGTRRMHGTDGRGSRYTRSQY